MDGSLHQISRTQPFKMAEGRNIAAAFSQRCSFGKKACSISFLHQRPYHLGCFFDPGFYRDLSHFGNHRMEGE